MVVKTRQQLACQPSRPSGHARVTRDRGLHPRHVGLRTSRPEPYWPEPAGRIRLRRLFAICLQPHVVHRVDVTIYANHAVAAGPQAAPSGEDMPAHCAQFMDWTPLMETDFGNILFVTVSHFETVWTVENACNDHSWAVRVCRVIAPRRMAVPTRQNLTLCLNTIDMAGYYLGRASPPSSTVG